MLSADFNLMESQGWRDTNPGTCSLTFSANYFWILVILADNLVGCPNQPHIFIAFLWGTPILSIGFHTYTGEIKRPRAVPVDMQAIHLCWNLRIPIMWEKTHLSRLVIQKGSRKKSSSKNHFSGAELLVFVGVFFFIWRFFPKSGALGDLTESQLKLTKIFTISYIHESDVYLHIFLWNHLLRRAGLSSVYTKTSGWLLEGFPHQKNYMHMGAIFFCHHCFRQDPAGKSIMRSWMLSSHPFMSGMLWEGMLCAGVEGVNAWVVFFGEIKDNRRPPFYQTWNEHSNLGSLKGRFDKLEFRSPKKLSLHSGKLT